MLRGWKNGCKPNGRSIKFSSLPSPNNGRSLLLRAQRRVMRWPSLILILISQTKPCLTCRSKKATSLVTPSAFIASASRASFLMKWPRLPILAKACGTPLWKQAKSLVSRLMAPKRCMCSGPKKVTSWLVTRQTARPRPLTWA